MPSLLVIVAVACGGAVGAVLRLLVGRSVETVLGAPAWAGTLVANLVGCLAIGLLWSWIESRGHAPWVRGLLVTGLLGAFTTFSTFGLDVLHLLHDRRPLAAGGLVVASVALGTLAVAAGIRLHDVLLSVGDAGAAG